MPSKAGTTWAGNLAAQHLVIEIGVQIGQDGAARLEPLDPGERVVEREMARVRPVAQRIDDPDVEAGERRDALRRQAAQVARIGEVAEAEAEEAMSPCSCRIGSAVIGAALPLDGDGLAGRQPVLGDDRRIVAAGRRREAIAEAGAHRLRRVLVEIDVDALAAA